MGVYEVKINPLAVSRVFFLKPGTVSKFKNQLTSVTGFWLDEELSWKREKKKMKNQHSVGLLILYVYFTE